MQGTTSWDICALCEHLAQFSTSVLFPCRCQWVSHMFAGFPPSFSGIAKWCSSLQRASKRPDSQELGSIWKLVVYVQIKQNQVYRKMSYFFIRAASIGGGEKQPFRHVRPPSGLQQKQECSKLSTSWEQVLCFYFIMLNKVLLGLIGQLQEPRGSSGSELEETVFGPEMLVCINPT